MGKSKKRKSSDTDKENRKLWRKFRKLEDELNRIKTTKQHDHVHNDFEEYNNDVLSADIPQETVQNNSNDAEELNTVLVDLTDHNGQNIPSVSESLQEKDETHETTEGLTIKHVSGENKETDQATQNEVLPVDEDIIKILGEDPSSKEEELSLSTHITSRWKAWLKSGNPKEVKEGLLKKYVRKGECLLEAPKLNPEIAASLNESATKRDKYFSITQNLAGTALSALGQAIDPLLNQKKEDVDIKKLLERLWETSKLIAEVHRNQTVARRACIIPSLKKQVAATLEKTEPDSFLFGEDLKEKLKSAKSVEKMGQEIKTQSQFKKPTMSLNFKGPAQSKMAAQTGFKARPSQRNSRPFSSRQPYSQRTNSSRGRQQKSRSNDEK